MTTIVAAVADTHCNSRTGLCTPVVRLDAQEAYAEYRASKMQRVLWNKWQEYWQHLEALKAELGAELYAVLDGDGSDDNWFRKVQLISVNKSDILRLIKETFAPMRRVADKIFVIRGTPVHVGRGAWMEEALAKELDAEPDKEADTFSWWWLPLEVEGVRFHFAHKPPTSGQKPWTRDAAAGRCSKEIRDMYLEWGDKPPDVACFAHFHVFYDSGVVRKPHVVQLPSWTFPGLHRAITGHPGEPNIFGGVWFICEGGKYRFDYMTWKTRRKKAWKPR